MSNGKSIIVLLTVGLIKKMSLYEMSYFPLPYTCNKSKIKVDLSSYARNSHFKNATGVDTSKFAKEADLASLK